jgi:hypothetical protein
MAKASEVLITAITVAMAMRPQPLAERDQRVTHRPQMLCIPSVSASHALPRNFLAVPFLPIGSNQVCMPRAAMGLVFLAAWDTYHQ